MNLRALRYGAASLSAPALALAALAACSGADPHPAGSSAPTGDGSSAPTGDGGLPSVAPDGALANPALCKELARGGDVVVETERVGRPSDGVGGEVTPGTYDLAYVSTFIASNPDCHDGGAPALDAGTDPDAASSPTECAKLRLTERVAQATLLVTEYAIRRAEARGVIVDSNVSLGAPVLSAVVYETAGTSLSMTSLCPSGGDKQTLAYSASGAALTFLANGREESFVRRP